jgi:hypothetical protein
LECLMRVLVLVMLMAVPGPAHAEATTRAFLVEYDKATEDGQRLLVSFLGGLLAAYTWSNVTLKAEGKELLFCPNTQFGRESEDPVKMVRRIVSVDPTTLDAPVGAAMLANLKRRFPCRKSKD